MFFPVGLVRSCGRVNTYLFEQSLLPRPEMDRQVEERLDRRLPCSILQHWIKWQVPWAFWNTEAAALKYDRTWKFLFIILYARLVRFFQEESVWSYIEEEA